MVVPPAQAYETEYYQYLVNTRVRQPLLSLIQHLQKLLLNDPIPAHPTAPTLFPLRPGLRARTVVLQGIAKAFTPAMVPMLIALLLVCIGKTYADVYQAEAHYAIVNRFVGGGSLFWQTILNLVLGRSMLDIVKPFLWVAFYREVLLWGWKILVRAFSEPLQLIVAKRIEDYYHSRVLNRSYYHSLITDTSALFHTLTKLVISCYELIADTRTDLIEPAIMGVGHGAMLIKYLWNNPAIYRELRKELVGAGAIPSRATATKAILLLAIYGSYTLAFYGLERIIRSMIISPARAYNRAMDFYLPGEFRWNPVSSQESRANKKLVEDQGWLTVRSMACQNKLMQEYNLRAYYNNCNRILRTRSLACAIQDTYSYLLDSIVHTKKMLDYPLMFLMILQFSFVGAIFSGGKYRLLLLMMGIFARVQQVVSTIWTIYNSYHAYVRDVIELAALAKELEKDLIPPFTEEIVRRADQISGICLRKARSCWLKNMSIDLDIPLSEMNTIFIVGPSGGGKTTLVDTLAGHLPVVEGEVLHGPDVTLAMISQYPGFFNGTLQDNITFQLETEVNVDALRHALTMARIPDLGSRLGQEIRSDAIPFSGGQRQRINFARFFYHYFTCSKDERPTVLVLDESYSAIDNINRRAIQQDLAKIPVKILSITHNLQDVPQDGEVCYVDNHRVLRGTRRQLRANPLVAVAL